MTDLAGQPDWADEEAAALCPDVIMLMGGIDFTERREKIAAAIRDASTRNAELKANEAAYERIVGPKTYQEVADEIAGLRATNAALEKERDEAVNWTDIVDRHGTDQFDDLAEAWLAMEPIQRVHNAVASVFSKWANDELMTRFKSHMASTLQIAFVEGCLVGVRAAEAKARAALTPTPAPQERQNG